MSLPKRKAVLLPIEVPEGKYCWANDGSHTVCEFFDNEGGHGHCTIPGMYIDGIKGEYLKDSKCAALEEVKDGD